MPMPRWWGHINKRLFNRRATPFAFHTLVLAGWLSARGLATSSLQPRSAGRVFP
jgi:hypothetical protein